MCLKIQWSATRLVIQYSSPRCTVLHLHVGHTFLWFNVPLWRRNLLSWVAYKSCGSISLFNKKWTCFLHVGCSTPAHYPNITRYIYSVSQSLGNFLQICKGWFTTWPPLISLYFCPGIIALLLITVHAQKYLWCNKQKCMGELTRTHCGIVGLVRCLTRPHLQTNQPLRFWFLFVFVGVIGWTPIILFCDCVYILARFPFVSKPIIFCLESKPIINDQHLEDAFLWPRNSMV